MQLQYNHLKGLEKTQCTATTLCTKYKANHMYYDIIYNKNIYKRHNQKLNHNKAFQSYIKNCVWNRKLCV